MNSYQTLRDMFFLSRLTILTLQRRSADRFIQRPSPYRAVNTFHLGYRIQSVYAVSGTLAACPQINTKHINTVWAERTVVECSTVGASCKQWAL
jgi:hypothetical protein